MPHSIYSARYNSEHGTESANYLHRQFEDIIERWEGRVRSMVPAAHGKTHEDLTDSLPFFLHGLIEALSVDGEDIETGDAAHAFRKHGDQRARMDDFTLNQMLAEYGILRTVLLEVMGRNVDLSIREHEIINRAVDFGMRESCAEFVQARMAHYQRGLLWSQTQHERDRHILEGLKDSLVSLDFESRFYFINDAATRLFNRPKDELITRNIWDIFDSKRSPKFFELCKAAVEQRETRTLGLTDREGCVISRLCSHPSKEGFSLHFVDLHEEPISWAGTTEIAPWLSAQSALS